MPNNLETSQVRKTNTRLKRGELEIMQEVFKEQWRHLEREGQEEDAREFRQSIGIPFKVANLAFIKLDVPKAALHEAVNGYVARSADANSESLAMASVPIYLRGDALDSAKQSELDGFDFEARAEKAAKAIEIMCRYSPEEYGVTVFQTSFDQAVQI